MFLKDISIFGFKSFANRIALNFTGGINIIVGPNGCGKSNIADALKWVLGETSIKSLRSDKLENIIFNGNEFKKALSIAEVALTFSGVNKVLNVPYEELSVKRRYYRNGESEFFINNNACRLKDIIDLFLDTGMGKNDYSFFEQGKIDEIINKKPLERRYIFEEAAGVAKYRARREEAERKLDNTNQNLLRLADIIDEVEKQRNSLKRQAGRAIRFRELKTELASYEKNFYYLNYTRLNEEARKKESVKAEISDRLTAAGTAIATAESDLTGLKNDYYSIDQQLYDLQKGITDLNTEISSLRSVLNESEFRKDGLSKQTESNLAEIEKIRQNIDKSRLLISEYEAEAARLGAEYAAKKNELDALTSSKGSSLKTLEDQKSGFDTLKNGIIELEKKLIDIKNRIVFSEENSSKLERTILRINTEKEEISKKLAALRASVAAAEKKQEEKSSALTGLQAQKEELKEKLENIEAEKDEIKANLEKVNKDYLYSHSRLKVLAEFEEDYEGYFSGVKKLMKEVKNNKNAFPGLLDVVAAIIKVPTEYEKAIEYVLGNALQNIVIEKAEFVEPAINFLNRTKSGRVTFLPIDLISQKVKRGNRDSAMGLPGAVGVAKDLVSFDSKFEPVLEYLLGNVLIVSDFRAALNIAKTAKTSFKIVTINGEIINTTGIITGGAHEKDREGLITRRRIVEEIGSRVKKLEDALNSCRKEESRIQKAETDGKAALQTVLNGILNINGEKEIIERELIALRSSLSRDAENEQTLEKESGEYQLEVVSYKTSTESLAAERTLLETELTRRQAELSDILATISQKEKSLNELIESINNYMITLATLGEKAANIKKESEIYKAGINEGEDRITQLKAENDRLIAERSGIDTGTADVARKLGDKTSEKSAREKEYETAVLTRDKVKNSLSEKETLVKDHTNEANRQKNLLYDLDIEISKINLEMSNILEKLKNQLGADLSEITPDETISSLPPDQISAKITEFYEKIEKIGSVDYGAIEEYEEVQKRFEFLNTQREDLNKAQEDLIKVIDKLNKTSKDIFAEVFAKINEEFGNYFRLLFGGGKAQLVFEDEANILESGIDIIAQPPGKKLQNINLMSGGEKSLVAISLLFSLLKVRPSPFCLFDEIDAALDESNIERFKQVLKSFTEKTQFIIITHNKRTMETADNIYGITMEEPGVSRLVSIKLEDAMVL